MPKRRRTLDKRGRDQYTNRSNHFVVTRMLQAGRKRFLDGVKETYKKHMQERDELRASLGAERDSGLGSFVRKHRVQARICELDTRIGEYVDGTLATAWDTKTRQLSCRLDSQSKAIARMILSSHVVGRPVESFRADPYNCPRCVNLYEFDPVANMYICNQCGRTEDVLFVREDESKDMLVTMHPGAGVDTSNERARRGPRNGYVRSPLYRRYVEQFGDRIEQIPTSVMQVLYKYLSTIHLQNSIRCRPTPVANVLRSNGLTHWTRYATRISMMFNGEPIPVMDDALIERLVHRFDAVFAQASRDKQRLPSFTFVTNVFLRIEGHSHLADAFPVHKTTNILQRTYQQLRGIIEKIPPSDEISWDNLPVF